MLFITNNIQTSHTHGYYRPSRLLLFKAKTIISMAESDNPSLPDDVHEPDELLDTFSVVGSMKRLSVFDLGVNTVRCGVFITSWMVVGRGVISGTVLSTVGVLVTLAILVERGVLSESRVLEGSGRPGLLVSEYTEVTCPR